MVKVPEEFINGVRWSNLQALETVLSEHISAVVEKIIREEVHSDTSDTAEVAETGLIG